MIVVKLWGGMCNQFFQYAFGYALSRLHNDELVFDTSFYDSQPSYVGKRKCISQNEFPHVVINNNFRRTKLINFIENKYVSHILRYNTGLLLNIGSFSIVMEKLYKYYREIPYKESKINYYDGYWQSEKYFAKIKGEIKNILTPNNELIETVRNWRESIDSDCCVAVHIRRGDYVRESGNDNLQGGEYYKQAMDYMTKNLNNPMFCIFSDDLEWCKNQFESMDNIIYVENKREHGDIIDLFSISMCEHGIMSLSTFSWWGNWLRENDKDSIVVYPEGKYFNDYFMPANWKKFSLDKFSLDKFSLDK